MLANAICIHLPLSLAFNRSLDVASLGMLQLAALLVFGGFGHIPAAKKCLPAQLHHRHASHEIHTGHLPCLAVHVKCPHVQF